MALWPLMVVRWSLGHSFPDIYFHSQEFGNRFSHSWETEFPTESGR